MLIKSEFSEELATVIFFQLKSIEKYFEFEQLFVDKKTRQTWGLVRDTEKGCNAPGYRDGDGGHGHQKSWPAKKR